MYVSTYGLNIWERLNIFTAEQRRFHEMARAREDYIRVKDTVPAQ